MLKIGQRSVFLYAFTCTNSVGNDEKRVENEKEGERDCAKTSCTGLQVIH